MSFREIVEGDVNYAKMHTQANPKYASGTKWRKSSAAVKAKADDVGAGELGAHGGGSGHVSVKATMNQRDKLATRQEINAGGHKTFAIKQTRLPRTSVRKPLPEGLEDMSGKFRELVEATTRPVPKQNRTEKQYHVVGTGSHHEDLRPKTTVSATTKQEAEDKAKDYFASKGIHRGSHYAALHAKEVINEAQLDEVNISATAVNESKIKDPSMQRISRELLESVLIEQPAALIESSQDANKWLATANHALNNADGSTGLEHHKWMAVHHKAMAIHAHKTGNSDAEQLHDKMSERHSDHVPFHDNEDHPDEHFHDGVSHHWNRF